MLISIINNSNYKSVSPYRYNKKYIPNNDSYNINLNNQSNAYYNQIRFSSSIQQRRALSEKHNTENYEGCIIGGAIGDALGNPIEFYNLQQIQRNFGEDGLSDLITGESGKAEITDDTQLTFFTADGLLKSIGQNFKSNEIPDINIIYDSYKDWLETQLSNGIRHSSNKGWVLNIGSLYAQRNPGDTCLSALESGEIGTMSKPLNNSKGNGGVMRVAPVGLLYYKNPKVAFETAARCAAITHGHPSGYLSAGFFASMIAYVVQGYDIESAIDKSMKILDNYENNEEVIIAVNKAKTLAKTNISEQEAITQLGRGWVGEEAISIAIYCGLKHKNNYEKAVLAAVNHNGDSDSTGAITGNLMGLYLGKKAIPQKWRKKVELYKELKTLAQDLYNAPKETKQIKERYPYNMGRVPNWYGNPQTSHSVSQIKQVQFSKKDRDAMKHMSTKEIIAYKRYLIQNKLYKI